MRDWNLAIGIYQNLSTANVVLKELEKEGFRRFAYIHKRKKDGPIFVHKFFPSKRFELLVVIILSVVIWLISLHFLSILSAILVFLFLSGLSFLWFFFSSRINPTILNRYKELVGSDEILVIAQVKSVDIRGVLGILRQVKTGHPASFLLRSEILEDVKTIELPTEPLTTEQMRVHAIHLANMLPVNPTYKKSSGKSLLNRLQDSKKILQFLRHDLAAAEFIEQTITLSAEWLLDNMYVIEGSIEEVQRNLPRKYYQELPKVLSGPFAGFPRIYAVAVEIVNSVAGRLNRESIIEFLKSYQEIQPLTIGELWALSLMLRLRLVECIQSMSISVDRHMRDGELANFWGNRLLYAVRNEPNRLPIFLQELASEQTSPSPHFAQELLDHLFDEETVIPLVRKWLEDHFKTPLSEIIRQDQVEETAEQVAFSSSVVSLITLSQLLWSEIVEAVSPVDAILKNDPLQVYLKMDFDTRNSYREAVEIISRGSDKLEVDVAKQALDLSSSEDSEFKKHVGYFLIDDGRIQLEKILKYRPSFGVSIRRFITRYSAVFYLGGIFLFTLILESYLFYYSLKSNVSLLQTIIFSILLILPLSELGVQLFNLLLSKILPPYVLPKMSYEQEMPTDCKTLVVIPMMLNTPDEIQEQLHLLEIRYLANSDPSIYFGLFSDFLDAPQKEMPNDASLLEVAVNGIQELENKYGAGKFFLFHRQRQWSVSENAWIGLERKRGKLEYLNRYLSGEKLSENILYIGQAENLQGIRYVITLDADTQLPKNKAKELVAVLSHPLNRPYLDQAGKGLLRGYTIIQPRVSTDFTRTKVSWFSKIFAEASFIDPYTRAISNVYQDLTSEGTYHGKGIYDLHAFYTLLSDRFPEEHLLSHDLIEGVYGRVGFASDICLFDVFPEDYFSWANRQHRWMRGDFQIVDWLFRKVPSKGGTREKNPLDLINRWKILDNLRRALMPFAIILLLICAWIISPIAAVLTLIAAFVLFIPSISLCIAKLLNLSIMRVRSLHEIKYEILRNVITISLLPYEAYLSCDALFRVIYRRMISHRNLLQWVTPEYGVRSSTRIHQHFLIRLLFFSISAIALFILIRYFKPNAAALAFPFCFLWAVAPIIIYFIDKPLEKRLDVDLSENDIELLRSIARKTWRYFDDFVGPETHWLPPDNYQTALKVEVAQRTSPTNIGLWLIAILNAYDLKYITNDQVIEKSALTLQTLKKLERFEGHFLNWFDIATLAPLYPRYISTVDSGNLLASFWTLKQSLEEIIVVPIIPSDVLRGIKDTYEILEKEMERTPNIQNEYKKVLLSLKELLYHPVTQLDGIVETIRSIQQLIKSANLGEVKDQIESFYWLKQIEKQIDSWDSIISRYFSWLKVLKSLSKEQLDQIDSQAFLWRTQALSWNPSLEELASGEIALALLKLLERSQVDNLSSEIKAWGRELKESLSTAQWFAGEKVGQVEELVGELDVFSDETNMTYLYKVDRKLFSIGYNIDERRLDTSYYDLLASEARISSLVAIAKGDVPVAHWWALGRYYTLVNGLPILLSWGGTMFEYLMPLLFNKYYPDSLLGEACANVIKCQVIYGKKRGIPWGISESAFSAIDEHRTYQYRSFGIPGVGLKRRLEEDLVVSPYSSGLALKINPTESLKNLKRLQQHYHLFGPYGFYESIDYLRQRGPAGERGVIVYAYMAHHQGMILTSINNILNNDIVPKRFHSEPRICGVDSLLYERIPTTPPIKEQKVRKEMTLTRLKPFSIHPIMGVTETPQSVIPKVNILSNGKYSIMTSNAGGGYSRWKDIDITRWRSDTTQDAWGNFCYIKDMKSGEFWSTAFHPTQRRGLNYSVNFKPDKTEFRRKDKDIETFTEIMVSPEDDAEVWLITLINHSSEVKYLELTSYAELALAEHAADRAHPVFNKLFIETEAIPEHSALLGFRRLKSADEKPFFAAHVLATNLEGDVQYETDRNRFIGRGMSLQHPTALNGDLSNTSGTVLDPIFSLRKRFFIEPGMRVQLSFITAMSENRDHVLALVEKCKDLSYSQRVIDLAWTHAQLELRHLRIHQEEVQLFQKLASRILYPHAQLRSSEEKLKSNRLGQSELWKYGISGDLPIVVVTVGDVYDVNLVKQVLIAHTFWNLRGLKSDLVILNEEEEGYERPLHEQIQRMIQAHTLRDQVEAPGGIFLRNVNQIPNEDLNLILSVARVVLVAARGTLRQQLVSPLPPARYPTRLVVNRNIREEPSQPLPFLELPYFNGLGGFTSDGKAYVIYLDANKHTPAPWINVIANSEFGTMVSETGLGSTWFGNSQTNRITPWSNDPLLDPICDAIYIRDDETGKIWNPTPSPIRELDAYRATHGQGYSRFEHNSHGINQDLLIFVPVNDQGGLPVRIQRLLLRNQSSRRRQLSVFSYSELVLGTVKEETQIHIVTEWDSDSQSLFAYNHYHPDYGDSLAFFASLNPVASYTGDRTEFLGRNHVTSNPEGLRRKSFSGHTGAALDPCSAQQVLIQLEPGEEKEITFILGYANNDKKARELIGQCRSDGIIEKLFEETKAWWDKTLGGIQVDVPDLATQFSINRWLLYQDLSCRIWGRSAFYQSSGAYGFRDQLQDVLALVYSVPNIAREQILRAAAHQFVEGDVQHWWHPPSGGGIRTRISDDLLWLPYATAQYVRTTGDVSILDEKIPFLEAPLLTEDQHEVYSVPVVTAESESLLEHCRRAIQKGVTSGDHGLPLIGGGDWNDGLNRVGIKGKGESVWLGWFIIHVMHDYADLLDYKGQEGSVEAEGFRVQAKYLAKAVEESSWDGQWYRRAYFDDGTPLGSKSIPEASIDSLAQSWAVICGLGDPERVRKALNSAEEYLVKTESNIVLLLTPPFDKSPLDPGYIKGYPPGVRENGGQYTHGSQWLAMAFARMGDGNKAVELLHMMNPITHTPTVEACDHYKVEPYVIVADIYDLQGQVGRGGWTWYTGSAGWLYRIWLEEILGFKLRGQKLKIECAIPREWDGFKVIYRYQTSTYNVNVTNPNHVSGGKTQITLDGEVLSSEEIPLINDGKNHIVDIVIV